MKINSNHLRIYLAAVSMAVLSWNSLSAEPVRNPGNGHYYELFINGVSPTSILFDDAKNRAISKGGYLASITSQAEKDFVQNTFLTNNDIYTFLGGYQPAGSIEPGGGWAWLSGEPWSYTNWKSYEPNNTKDHNPGGEDKLQAIFFQGPSRGRWNDTLDTTENLTGVSNSYLVEWNTNPNPDETGPHAMRKSSLTGEEAWRLDAGAETTGYADPRGNWWMADEPFYGQWRWGFENGNSAATTDPIQNTDLQPVYQNNRWGGTNMAYHVELPKGVYQVRLMFCETYWNEPGKRVFDVALEGVRVLSDLDIFASAGGKNIPLDRTFSPLVTDGVLDITFPAIAVDNALISGIEIIPVSITDDDFLDFVEKKSFWFFWNQCDPVTGHVKDRESGFAAPRYNYSSIAATGFGLSAITVAAKRGWITPQQARDRIMTTLGIFETMPNVHGFWYHFLNMHTSQPEPGTEVSTADSALFILGALQAGEYFRQSYLEIAQKAEALYRRMEWDWWLNRGPADVHKFMNQAWIPGANTGSYTIPGEGGYFNQAWWDMYAESIFIYLAAMGSPTHPIPYDAWRDLSRRWRTYHGYHMITQPPLFTHQYQHLWFNMETSNGQKLHDGFANYAENITNATLQNKASTAQDSRYEDRIWGLTASDGPAAYTAYGAPPEGSHDGTVAPTAALSSIRFTSQESIAAARYMYFQYKHRIWGQHGFTDAFNISTDWRGEDSLGIDQGALLLAIENYRTGMVRDTAMASPYLRNGMAAAQFKALDQAPLYTASEVEGDNPAYQARYAADGNPSTRWSSPFADPQWIQVEYASAKNITGATIQWEAAYAKSYRIQVSNDGKTWNDAYRTSNGQGGTETVSFPQVTAKYLRIYCSERATGYGYSIYEWNVIEAAPLIVAHYRASSSESALYPPSNSGDGDPNTRWSSEFSDPQWLQMEFSSETRVNKLDIRWEAAYALTYHVEASADGLQWQTHRSVFNGTGGLETIYFPTATTRFLRLNMTVRATPYGYSIYEIKPSYDTAPPFAALNAENAKSSFPEADGTFKLNDVYSYPNPSRGKNPTFHIECGLADSAEIQVYDASGESIYQSRLLEAPGVIEGKYAYEHPWDISGVPSGVYIYSVTAKKAGERDLRIVKKLAVIK